ncbi:hypothetical protein [Streptococcus suis]|uniref:hypothetical protein n=1 Tax=Streptococcus suis TaxID=1307 RepID=UPI002AA4C4EA|nr:hypothetical protein [Streptococcus suis]HEM6533565.1 hypothetical protein [Streptococcus suis]HEM6561078.1 hypothetical protein [Streptococcus suis]
MNEIEIKSHSFDLAKNRLKEFLENTEAELEIKKVRTSGDFLGLGDHMVTGYELNQRLEMIQKHFITVNTTSNMVIKEFREVYNALDVLDKDYISSIIANVKAIEKTSNDIRSQQGVLKQHNEKLINQQNKLDAHQMELEKSVESISKIISVLKVFKEKLESYEHLTDIDTLWKHKDEQQMQICQIEQKCMEQAEQLNNLIQEVIQKNKDEVNKQIAGATQTTNVAIENLTTKIKYSYWIAGGSACLAIIELILLLM